MSKTTKPEYTIMEKYRVQGVLGFCYKTKFQCDKGVFIASEATDPLGVEVCIMNEKGGFETEPLRRLSTKEAIELFVSGKWPE